jgi:hypothetical protein
LDKPKKGRELIVGGFLTFMSKTKSEMSKIAKIAKIDKALAPY